MVKNEYYTTFEDFLGILEFSFRHVVYHDEVMDRDVEGISLIDLTGANLNHIEDDFFPYGKGLISSVLDRLKMYIDDYFLDDINETCEKELDDLNVKEENLEVTLEKLKSVKNKSFYVKSAIKELEMLYEPEKYIDMKILEREV